MSKPKLVSSPTIKRVKDRQFYTELIRQCELVLPMVDEDIGLCHWIKYGNKFNKPLLENLILRIVEKQTIYYHGWLYPYKRPLGIQMQHYKFTPAWKSDRIFLLKEIIKYCEYKLKQP